ncbi:hypothetical protein PHJA_002950000 [Phtheirospermum japonicum]|uniref:Uncharacterized protein n=1 Tax=Phtheirospermum japonicum TaxID=374723 RepID=A0A830D9Z5_9LAMI|nr:hypothetical protein PHJA_002950000 [Phtheirospermum japonicum]
MSSVCSPGGGFTAANFHNFLHQPMSRNAAVELNIFAKFAPLNQPSIGIDCGKPFRIRCAEPEAVTETIDLSRNFEEPKADDNGGGGDGGNRFFPNGGGGGGEGGEGEGDEEEFGPIMKYDEVLIEAERRGRCSASLTLLEAAKSMGLRRLILSRYLDLQGCSWAFRFLMRHCSMLRNRMLADPAFLFKVGTEVVIDSCCATFAEVKQRGKDFLGRVFELYAADLLVGIVVDVALVGMLALTLV